MRIEREGEMGRIDFPTNLREVKVWKRQKKRKSVYMVQSGK